MTAKHANGKQSIREAVGATGGIPNQKKVNVITINASRQKGRVRMSVCKDHPIDDRDFYWMNYLKDKCPHCQLAALQAENERLREALIYLDEECEIIDFADKAKKMIRAALSSAGKEAP